MDIDKPIPKKKAAASSSQPTEKKKRGSTKRKKSTGSSSSNVDLSKLLPFVSRANLEGIITASIRNDLPPNVADIISTLPESDRWRFTSSGQQRKKVKSVESGPERVNTGSFNAIDTSTMANIMAYLPSKDCHTVVSSVCKGWRELKTSIPSLFIDLSDNSWDYEEPGSGYRSKKSMKASTLSSLLDWVPNLAAVTGLRISTQDKCNPNTCKQIVKKLAAAVPDTGSKKSKKTSGKKKNLAKLVLHGPKIYGSLMAELVRQETGAGLKYLQFSQVKQTNSTKLEGSVAAFFKTCSQLEELHMPQALASASGLRATLTSSLSAARSGSTTLLRVLDLSSGGGSFDEQRLQLRDIADLGSVCPELEVLRLAAASGCPTGASTDFLLGPFVPNPMVSLPRLKEFSLGRIVENFTYRSAPNYASTQTVNRLLTWLLVGMPNVQKFSFSHGSTHMTRKDEKTFSYPVFPGIGEIVWPTSLKHLKLRNLALESSAFENADLPSLETLKLSSCGTNTGSIIDGLGRSHPDVEATEDRSWSRW